MNVLNRIVMVVGIVLGLALSIWVMVMPLDAAYIARANVEYFEASLFDDQFFFLFLVGVGVAEFLLLVLLWLEVRRPRRKTVRIKTQGGGRAELGIESVGQSLEFRIDELAGVRKVQPRVTSRGRDVEVRIDLDTSPSVNIPVLTDQIVDLCHDIVEGQLGVRIHNKVRVNIKHEPYPRGTMPVAGPRREEPTASLATLASVEPTHPPVAQPEQAIPVSMPAASALPDTIAEDRFSVDVPAEGSVPEDEPGDKGSVIDL